MSTLAEVKKREGTSFRCSDCGETFSYISDGSWDDDAAAAEATGNGFADNDDLVVICDDCYNRIFQNRESAT